MPFKALWSLCKSNSCISWFRNDGEMKVLKVHMTCHYINEGFKGTYDMPLYK